MNFLVLKERREGHERKAIRQSPVGIVAEFDYVVTPDPGVESLAVVFREGLQVGDLFVPAVRAGAAAGRSALAECSQWLCSMKVEVVGMRRHPPDSDLTAFGRLAKQFVQGTLVDATIPLLSLDPSWRTPDVLALARQAHRSGASDGLLMLADALEEAGCDFALLLEHCRSGCEHGGACWAVQLALAEPG